MLTPAAALALILGQISRVPAEACTLEQAGGRVLREDIRADRDLPPYDRIMMDGYALRSASLGAGLRRFRVEGIQAAGMSVGKLGPEPGACLEAMTGGLVPEGADCVVPYEETQREGGEITLGQGVGDFGPGHAVHRRGSDHRAGEVLVPAGTRLGGREIAIAATCGCGSLMVSRRPTIAVVATGDELMEVGGPVAAHQIRRSNDYALQATLLAAGFPDVSRFHLPDDPREIERRMPDLLAGFDLVVFSGGVSKGKFDYLPAELERQGVRRIFHGLAQRPGKPMWFGMSARETPIFALPGNPVSTYTCLHRYVLPAVEHGSGRTATLPRPVTLAADVNFKPKLAYLLPVTLSTGPQGEQRATPAPTNSSGDFAGLLGTDGFVELPAERDDFPAGTLAPFWSWA